MVGPRQGKYSTNGRINALPGANLPLATLGTFILWMGWFGFNGGSELVISNVGEANAVAAVFVNTNAAAAGGVVAALVTAKIILGRADLTMVLNGALAGLVAITAEPLGPSPLAATLIGAVGGVIVVFSVLGLDRIKIDDPGRRHLGSRHRRDLGSAGGSAQQCRGNTFLPIDRHGCHFRLCLHSQPRHLGRNQGSEWASCHRRGGIPRCRCIRMRSRGIPRIHIRSAVTLSRRSRFGEGLSMTTPQPPGVVYSPGLTR